MTKKEAESIAKIIMSKAQECEHVRELIDELILNVPILDKYFMGSFYNHIKETKTMNFYAGLFQPNAKEISLPDGFQEEMSSLFIPFGELGKKL